MDFNVILEARLTSFTLRRSVIPFSKTRSRSVLKTQMEKIQSLYDKAMRLHYVRHYLVKIKRFLTTRSSNNLKHCNFILEMEKLECFDLSKRH